MEEILFMLYNKIFNQKGDVRKLKNKDLDFMLDIENMDDMAFESFLAENLSSVEAPKDLHSRIMSEVAQEMAEPAKKAAIFTFPSRRLVTGFGTCAAAVALVFGVGLIGDDVEQVLNPVAPEIVIDKPEVSDEADVDVVAPEVDPEEVVDLPEADVPEADDVVAPVVTDDVEVAETVEPAVDEVIENEVVDGDVVDDTTVNDVVDATEQTGDVVMPTAAYGTEATGAVAVRMVAAVDDADAYAPIINDKGSKVLFYTEEDDNLYQWQCDITSVSEPTAMLVAEDASEELCDEVLVNTTAVNTMNTIVFSPDNTWIAINSRGDQQGVWLSANSGKDLWQLCVEGGGDLLAWAPNSSKFLFTDAEGKLYAAYPVEQRIFLVSDLEVTDIVWGSNSTTAVFVANSDGEYNAVYTVEIP